MAHKACLLMSVTKAKAGFPGKEEYLCFTFTGTGPHIGNIPSDWRHNTIDNGSCDNNVGRWACSGLHWFCGLDKLLVRMPLSGQGV